MLVIIRIGGSVIATPVSPDLISQYTRLLTKLGTEGHRIVVVVGGGALAREFIAVASRLGLGEEAQDWIAIHISRLYALIFKLKLGHRPTERMPISVSEAGEAIERGEIVVMGGLQPGMTTDAVAAYIAQKTQAQLLIKATDQEGIYNKDPRKHADAQKLESVSFVDLKKLFGQVCHEAGMHQVLDPIAVSILQKTKTKVVVINGFNPQNIQHAIEGKRVGTIISE
ncbi:MAG: UMP kinase [Candidatus Bathyarchaeota archaeon]|jgi:uridylate kinase|nr:UMP kinase [Candidatus Bathyarchaeota archaeon]